MPVWEDEVRVASWIRKRSKEEEKEEEEEEAPSSWLMAFSQPDILPWLPALYPTPKKWSEAHSPRIPLLFLSAQESKRFIFLSPSLGGNFASGKTERNTSGYFYGESAFSGRKKRYSYDISVIGIKKRFVFAHFSSCFKRGFFFLVWVSCRNIVDSCLRIQEEWRRGQG